jgi:hypothetical protein
VCGETVEAPAPSSESTLKDMTTRIAECPRCSTVVEFIYNARHQPFGARFVTTD